MIGSMDDLEAASDRGRARLLRDLLRAGQRDAGDRRRLRHRTAIDLVNQYFGRVPKAAKPVPRDIPQEPTHAKEKRVTLEQPWPLPAVVVAYHVTYDGHPDSYPLHIVSKMLSDGQSSRIYRQLVYESGLALTAFGSGNIIEHPEPVLRGRHRPAGPVARRGGEGADRRVRQLKAEAITDRELQRAKNQFARDYILSRETIQQKASHLAHAVVIHEDMADGRRRVRHLPSIRQPTCSGGADLLHARAAAGADDHAEGGGCGGCGGAAEACSQ